VYYRNKDGEGTVFFAAKERNVRSAMRACGLRSKRGSEKVLFFFLIDYLCRSFFARKKYQSENRTRYGFTGRSV
jgi:hypothetical protein